MHEAWGLLVLGLAGLALAVLAEHRSRQLAKVTAERERISFEHHEQAQKAADFETLLQKSMTERVELTGRLATADDLKASYEEAALLVLQRMAEARAVLRKPRLKPEVRIQRALAIMEPKS